MRTVPKWVNKIHEADKIEFSCVHTICYSPDGTQLVIGAGEKVMVYDPRDGSLVQLLQAHKGAVHAVAYCGDGKKFASGSADKNVIIWTSKMEGVLKYSHGEAIQCLAYSPVTFHLASCAVSDFAFWSADVKAVQKYRVSGRITSCAWSPNGQYLAVGLAVGAVSIRDKAGDEIQRVTRDAAVWAVSFTKTYLLVSDWNETLSFYNVQGQQILKERSIGIAALSVSMLGELILIGGIGGWAVLTSEGVPILNTPQEWVWAIVPSPSLGTIAVGCQDGTLWCYQVVFSTVHGLYRERYAYREHMTDVIVQHLTTGSKVRIKCHDRVQKIAIYKHRLAVQLPERVVVYEQGDVEGMLYRVKEKLPQKTECSLLVATSDALLLCQDTKLSIIGRQIPKSWTVPSPIRYVKVTTLYFEEVLLLGLLNGQIWLVEPSGGSCRLVLATPASVRCLDVSASRARLAVVDDASVCRVYSLPTGELLYTVQSGELSHVQSPAPVSDATSVQKYLTRQSGLTNKSHIRYLCTLVASDIGAGDCTREESVSSVSWNAWCDELAAVSGGGRLAIKAAHFPPATQPLLGSVVGFQGGRVFCLQSNTMQTINVPLSHAVHQYVQQKMFNEAYAVACLGVTALDWERLGEAALEELSFEVARKAFQRGENLVFLSLIDHLQERFEAGEKRAVIAGEVLAYRGRHADAARAFRGAGRDDRALSLYVDLRMFNKAQEFVGPGEGLAALARRRAEWARHVNEPRAAAEMYLAAGDVRRAAQLMAESGRRDMLIELARKLDKGSSESLRYVAEALVAAGEPATAADVYQRLGDYRKVTQLAVAAGEWARAFALARDHAECRRDAYLPHAHRMARENKFVEAQKAYHMAGETGTAQRVFSILVSNAVAEERFSDAGYLHHLLAMQCLDTAAASDSREREKSMRAYHTNARLARIYHAYDSVHSCAHEPFSLLPPDALLNAARFVLAQLAPPHATPPPGVSLFCLYLCLAKQAKTLNAHSLARQMLDKILGLQIPQKFQESVELLMLKSRAGGAGEGEREDAAPLCWRCRRHLPAAPPARACPHCRHEPAHALPSHEVLPLVQFVPAEGISYEEAFELIERTTLPETAKEESGNAEVLRIDHDLDSSDPFLDKFDEEEESGVVVCSRGALLRLRPGCVLALRGGRPAPRLYRNMLPELPVLPCPHCGSLFYLEDYEVHLLTKGCCPFCRQPVEQRDAANDSSPSSPSPGSPSRQDSWR